MTGTPRPCYRSISIVADGRLEVCDGAHWAFVMKKIGYFRGPPRECSINGPAQAELGRSTLRIFKRRWRVGQPGNRLAPNGSSNFPEADFGPVTISEMSVIKNYPLLVTARATSTECRR